MPDMGFLWEFHDAVGLRGGERGAETVVLDPEVVRTRLPVSAILHFLQDLLWRLPSELLHFAFLRLEFVDFLIEEYHVFANPETSRRSLGRAPRDDLVWLHPDACFFMKLFPGVGFIRFAYADVTTEVRHPPTRHTLLVHGALVAKNFALAVHDVDVR